VGSKQKRTKQQKNQGKQGPKHPNRDFGKQTRLRQSQRPSQARQHRLSCFECL
jgi:hypothetical protein